jgi:hypothetical protein
MALDAFVYCDCFEKDNLRCNPPGDLKLSVDANGDISCRAPTEADWFAFSAWKQNKACIHPGMILIHHCLGTTDEIDLLRADLQPTPARFPTIYSKILYSSTHTCDWISVESGLQLTEELKNLNGEFFRGPNGDKWRLFKIKMAELVIASQHTRKPICF